MHPVTSLDSLLSGFGGLPQHTQFFIVAIAAATLAFHWRFSAKTVASGPTILTTTGIFATFLAIALGLSEFNAGNVQASVPGLLESLKTAFWASVIGVGGALTLKFRDYLFGAPSQHSGGNVDDVTAADLHAQLGNIHMAVAGREEGSLISQMKLSRQDTNDRLDALRAAQTEALAKLSEMGSKALVEALRDVIRDFNQKITEQFGDNFKELNVAVGRLLIWQEQYQAHVETTAQKIDEIGRVAAKATADYAHVVEQSSAFARVAHDMQGVLAGLEAEKQQLMSVSGELARLLQAASGSLPEVERKFSELTGQLANSITEHQRSVGETVARNSEVMRASVEYLSEELSELGGKIKDEVSALEDGLEDALQKSLTSLGQQLTALSEAFVEDYTPLTQKLQRLVQMAP
jgi:uncharacterized coiled-coil DUF342 family protein